MGYEENGVKFYLYTGNGDKKGTKLLKVKTKNYKINPEYPVKILCHGWMDDKKSYWYQPTIQEYLKRGNVNIITVHWGKFAKGLFGKAVKSVKMVGFSIAMLISDISLKYRIHFEKFHIIGHSLGSHIAGFAGKHIILYHNKTIGRITALDPAGPGYKEKPPEDRLCRSDANFVDVIHTDGGVLGIKEPLGHIDFYPNGGVRKQAGCKTTNMACSHKRAPLYFAESITSKKFIAGYCDSFDDVVDKKYNKKITAIMGEDANPNIVGIYYLETNNTSPYALGELL
ncbi:pancreatic lipase-related protein 2-like [Onthophagus taurus]|uniref:pancreatic lipase-related protein 2-like n=1 Tax=Onthophagus taurus TaxID=166361 RepID=UPI000C20339D|nr:pancreatic lipase-related protein 2-like [Onthophagus taurus]